MVTAGSLELFAAEVMPAFKAEVDESRTPQGRGSGAGHRGGAEAKDLVKPLADHEIPVVKASVAQTQVPPGISGVAAE